MTRRALDLTGQRFGNLTYIKPIGRRRQLVLWQAICDCGKVCEVTVANRKTQKRCSKGCPTYSKAAVARKTGMWKCEKHGNVKAARVSHGYHCSVCKAENAVEAKRKIKQLAVKHLGGVCSNCGYDDCIDALDCHHIDPSKKNFSISTKSSNWPKVKCELKNCILLCSVCHRTLHYNLLKIADSDSNSKYGSMSKGERQRERRRVNKLRALEYLGGKCVRCGYDDCVRALDFHHIDPSKKDFTIARIGQIWAKVKSELKKVIPLCSNCHKELHAGLWNLADLE